MSAIYGYIRASSTDQNESRQCITLEQHNIPADHIFMDKISGKDFQRPQYQAMLKRLRPRPLSLQKNGLANHFQMGFAAPSNSVCRIAAIPSVAVFLRMCRSLYQCFLKQEEKYGPLASVPVFIENLGKSRSLGGLPAAATSLPLERSHTLPQFIRGTRPTIFMLALYSKFCIF